MAIKTHYDTLKVTQDAPQEVIAAAFKALAMLYHPDRPGHTSADTSRMQDLNIAWQVLSNPQKRKEHDDWISQQERRTQGEGGSKRSAPGKESSASVANAGKWGAWAERTRQDAAEAQARADKAVEDMNKAKPEERAKWEAWVKKTAAEALEAKEKADKAHQQAQQAAAEAINATTKKES